MRNAHARSSDNSDAIDLAAVDDAVAAIARGEMIVVTDDDDRENEGDLTLAAALCTTEQMAFVIRHSSGIVCAPVDTATASRLRLDPMVVLNDAPLSTAFTVSVDAKAGLTTGIAAAERAATVRALADGVLGAGDFVRPGHVFPLIAREGGLLVRSGHTEAAVDLCRLAGLPPVGVIAELMNDDGTVMAGDRLDAFLGQHRIRRISIAALIAYRQRRERLVRRLASFPVETAIGTLTGYAFATPFDSVQHFAFVFGDVTRGGPVPTRIHRADVIGDVIGVDGVIARSLARFRCHGNGVLVYLRDAGGTASLATVSGDGGEALRQTEWREIGLGAQILRDLGITTIELLTSTPRRFVGLEGFDIEIASFDTVKF